MEVKTFRYLLVEKARGLQDPTRLRIAFTAPTCDELFATLHAYRTSSSMRSSGCAYQYYEKDRFELVDMFDEPGHVAQDKYWSYWVPGEPHVTPDDAMTIRFQQMELE